MAWQRAARRLRDLGLIELEQKKPGGQLLKRTKLGQKVVERYHVELHSGAPIRWPGEKPRRRQRENVAPLRAHIEELCEEHEIHRSVNRLGAYARQTAYRRVIGVPQVYDRKDYFTALHEIGHIVLFHHARDRTNIRQEERDAWDWALENARVKPTQAVRGMITRCLRSYGAA
jgi:hypothetical protein